ncbi:MAG: IS1 family transposase [Candidatus Electronema sp. V4]|uniref:IS1 family transposase n=1 Tax=Candidatus Electronema sp. V4 TaxID=3454756 RepID=UPI00405537B8
MPSEKYAAGKANTWKTERRNLNFRTHLKRLNRKTVCFSKDERIHDNVIGMHINISTSIISRTGDKPTIENFNIIL